jgi:hypothetical protein
MGWMAPDVTRIDEPFVSGERAMLEGFLEWQRHTLLHKCAGLNPEQLAAQPVPPSTLSMLGLIRHHIDVERTWFRRRFAGEDIPSVYYEDGNWDRCFNDVDAGDAESEYEALLEEWKACRQTDADRSLDDTFDHPSHDPMQLRWIYHHMIEEYARHNGHADLLRECIDGVTGT